MFKFISTVELDNVQRQYPKQHHWESRTAHILNHLWKDIEDKLPMPDMTDVPFDCIVPVFNISDFAKVMPEQMVKDGASESTGMATANIMIDGKFTNQIWIPAVELEDGTIPDLVKDHRSMDIHIFKHEITHCYQNLWEWKKECEQAKKEGIKIGSKEHLEWRKQVTKEHIANLGDHQQKSDQEMHKAIDDSKDKLNQAVANGMLGREIYTDILIPSDVASKMKEIELYCDMMAHEKEMVELAGKVWTPHFTFKENLMLYHNVFPGSLDSLISQFETMVKRTATRQKLEKVGLVPRMIQALDVITELAKIFREKAHQFIKMKYNYIERAEMQLAKSAA